MFYTVFALFLLFSIPVYSQNSTWEVFDSHNTILGDDFVLAYAIDSSGARWIGTMSAGMYRIDDGEWTRYDRDTSPLPIDTVLSVIVDPSGTRWVSTYGGGLVAIRDGQDWVVYDSSNTALGSNNISANALLYDSEGNIWAGTWGGGVSMFNGTEWVTYDTGNSPLPDQTVWAACVDSSDVVWFSTLEGIASFDHGEWTVYTTENSGIPLDDVASLCATSYGDLWVGTWGAGLAVYRHGGWSAFNRQNSPLPDDKVEALTYDGEERLWIGTWGGGVAVYDGKEWLVFDTGNSDLPSNNVRKILYEEGANRMWICTEGGLAAYSMEDSTVSVPVAASPAGLHVRYAEDGGSGTVACTVPVGSNLSIALYTLLGEQVWMQTEESGSGGDRRVPLPSSFAPGTYLCEVRAGNVREAVLLRVSGG